MHYVVSFGSNVRPPAYFDDRADLDMFISHFRPFITSRWANKIKVFRCPRGWSEYSSRFTSYWRGEELPKDYFLSTLKNYIL